MSGVEVINVRNVNGTAAVAPTAEKATVTFADVTVAGATSATVPNTATIIIGGRTVTLTGNTGDGTNAGANITFTAAQISSAFATSATTGLPSGITATGTVGAYTVTSASGSQVVFTSTGTGDVTNLTVTGTGAGAQSIAVVDGTSGSSSTGANIEVTASNYAGATDFNSVNSLNKVTFTGLSATQKLGIVGNGTVANGDVDYTSAATTVINVSGGTKQGTVTNTGSNVTTATINSTGAANTLTAIDLSTGTSVTSLTINAATDLVGTTGNNGLVNLAADYAATAALTVNGAASSVALGNGATANFKTIDASGLTAGGLTIALGTNATSFKGGQGNDVVTTAVIASTASIDAGAGTADVLVVNAAGEVDTAAEANLYKNFEILRTAASQDMSLFTASTMTGIQVLAGADIEFSKMTAAQAANVQVRGNVTAGGDGNVEGLRLTLADATGTADVASLTLGTGLTTSAATTLGKLEINGFETLNVKTNAGPTATAGANKTTTIGSFMADKLTAINLTGTAVTLTNAATTKATTIDASALTGDGAATPVGLTIGGDLVAGSVVKGSLTAGNTFNLGTAGSTYTGGAGKDAFNVTAVTQLRSGATYNVIDGATGEDTLTVTASAISMVDDDFKEIKNIEKIVLDADGGDGDVSVTTGGWYDANFKASGSDLEIKAGTDAVSFVGGTFTGNQKLTVTTAATSDNTSILTGDGNDTVKVTANAVTDGDISVSTGKGNDAIEIDVSNTLTTNAAIAINGGAGKDTIKLVDLDAADAQYVTITVGAGDSTLAAYDSITGYSLGGTAKSVVVDFAGTSAVAGDLANSSITGYTSAELLYKIDKGFVGFSGSKAANLTLAEKISVVDAVITTDLTAVAFKHGDNTYLYQENAAGDSLVELVGISTADTLALGGGTAGTTTIQIL